MMMLTKAIRDAFPEWASTDGMEDSAPVIVKFFDPTGSWTWYATEFDGVDRFFGLVVGAETELGYFSLEELEGVTVRMGLKIERDLHLSPHTITIGEARKRHER